MRSLQIGQLRYGAFCDDEGRMLGDGIAFRYDQQHYGAVTALPGDGEALLEAAGGAEFELRNVTAQTPHLQLQGPEAATCCEPHGCARRGAGLLPLPARAGGGGRRARASRALRLLR